jgi:acyl transferase domain-containing protein
MNQLFLFCCFTICQSSDDGANQSTAGILHLASANPHVATAFNMSRSKSTGAGWHLARQTGGAVSSSSSDRALTGVSSFAFQGTNAHATVGQANNAAALGGSSSMAATSWDHQRIWLLPRTHALVQSMVSQLSMQRRGQIVTLEAWLSSPRLAFMQEHVVRGVALMPVAAFLEMATAGTETLTIPSKVEARAFVRGAVFATPMALALAQSAVKVGLLYKMVATTAQMYL